MFEVINPGLETSVQDLPGRIGYWEQGIPPSGPMDIWSFQLANLAVGNPSGTAALECQFLGPSLRFYDDAVIAITGADMAPTLDDKPVAMWESVAVMAGQTLALGPAYAAGAGLPFDISYGRHRRHRGARNQGRSEGPDRYSGAGCCAGPACEAVRAAADRRAKGLGD